ncbi:hypothetical protein RZS08_01720, partial [Arthrospira platensis SPKY1]|nr:hypothetical protein [Arthrospira platensis SPKY1]
SRRVRDPAVRAPVGGDVFRAAAGQALRRPAGPGHDVELRGTGLVGHVHDPVSVGRPVGAGLRRVGGPGQPGQPAAAEIPDEQLGIAGLGKDQRHLAAVRRDRAARVQARVV